MTDVAGQLGAAAVWVRRRVALPLTHPLFETVARLHRHRLQSDRRVHGGDRSISAWPALRIRRRRGGVRASNLDTVRDGAVLLLPAFPDFPARPGR